MSTKVDIIGFFVRGGYWRVGGVTAALAERYRVISMDMRCHGRTIVEKEPWGFDVDTMAGDINAFADHLKLDKSHLLSHATDGMVAARYGMKHSDRLLSLMLTDTGSATQPVTLGMGGVEEYMQRMAEARLAPFAEIFKRENHSRVQGYKYVTTVFHELKPHS